MPNSKIKILFDAHPLIGNKSGIGYYTSQLISELAARYQDNLELVGYYHNFLGRKPRINEPAAPNIRYVPITLIPGQIVNAYRRYGLAPPIELLTLTKADFILYPNYLGLPSLFGTPFAPVIHDLTFVDHPQSMSDKNREDLNRFIPPMIERATFIVTVSQFSQSRICEHFKTGEKPIVITPNPPPQPLVLSPEESAEVLQKQGVTVPFILFVGTIEPRKNLITLLEAYTRLPADIRQTTALVIAGKIDWKYAETQQKLQQTQDAGHKIFYLGYVDDTTRAALYDNASLLVFPSYYEGFGMPILEAFSYDTPCAVSDIPVFHEVAGAAAAYFDPYDADSIARVIEAELRQPTSDSASRQRQLQQFDWSIVCQRLYDQILRSVKRLER